MASLQGSDNYIWSLHDILGQGATGAVYKARHKSTFELYAVKTFNYVSQMRPAAVQMRELEVLQQLHHKNIVQLLSIEEESRYRCKVLVMELCTGGSLFTLLDQPDNAFGLDDAEFFTMLYDVASGIKYLRDCEIVHRDIKPGNIMRCFDKSKRCVYKLIDFGAARQLDPEEQFMSLYGTEEYLHPDLYERAVLKRPTNKQFAATVDLWSLGVTLYHAASGQLPFRPYGGRSSRETTFHMTSRKASGVICGVQHEMDGEIEWCRHLPDTCQLSKGARALITPLLAGLMESDETLMWGFERFFDAVVSIERRHLLHVFNQNTSGLLHLYTVGSENDSKLRELLAEQLGIVPGRQLLLYDGRPLAELVRPLQPVNTYPKTSPDRPIFLFCSDCLQSGHHERPQIPALSQFCKPTSMTADAQVAKQNAGLVHLLLRACRQTIHCQWLMRQAKKTYMRVLLGDIERLTDYIQQFRLLAAETRKRWHVVTTTARTANHDSRAESIAEVEEMATRCRNALDDLQCSCTRLHADSSLSKWLSAKENLANNLANRLHPEVEEMALNTTNQQPEEENTDGCCRHSDRCIKKIEVYVEMVEEISSAFKQVRKQKLAHNDLQVHRFDAKTLQAYCVEAREILSEHCLQNTDQQMQAFQRWYIEASEMRRCLHTVESDISDAAETIAAASSTLDQLTRCDPKLHAADAVSRDWSDSSQTKRVYSKQQWRQLLANLRQLEENIVDIHRGTHQNQRDIEEAALLRRGQAETRGGGL